MNSAYDVIIRPIVSERSFDLIEQGKYTFEVAKSAPKEEIASAVEKLFGVHVVKVDRQRRREALRRPRGQGQHAQRLRQEEARPLPDPWHHALLEEGRRDPRPRRDDRDLRQPAGR